jgi:hypothetical protein
MDPDQQIFDGERERARRMRGKVLAHLLELESAKKPMPTNEDLKEFIGCDTVFGARTYLVFLDELGLIQITGLNRGIVLTDTGREVSRIISASTRPPTLFEEKVGLTRAKTASCICAAERLDENPKSSFSYGKMILTMRQTFNWTEAGKKLNVHATTLARKFEDVKEEMEKEEKSSIPA